MCPAPAQPYTPSLIMRKHCIFHLGGISTKIPDQCFLKLWEPLNLGNSEFVRSLDSLSLSSPKQNSKDWLNQPTLVISHGLEGRKLKSRYKNVWLL